jgi:hypothetical protein
LCLSDSQLKTRLLGVQRRGQDRCKKEERRREGSATQSVAIYVVCEPDCTTGPSVQSSERPAPRRASGSWWWSKERCPISRRHVETWVTLIAAQDQQRLGRNPHGKQSGGLACLRLRGRWPVTVWPEKVCSQRRPGATLWSHPPKRTGWVLSC